MTDADNPTPPAEPGSSFDWAPPEGTEAKAPKGGTGRRILIILAAVVAGFIAVAVVGALVSGRTGDTLDEYAKGELVTTQETPAFTAEFPTTPERETQTERAGELELEVIFYVSEVDDGAVGAGYTDYPPEVLEGVDPKTVLQGAASGSVARLEDGKVRRTTELNMFDVPAVEIEAEGRSDGQDAEMLARVFLKGSRIFFLIVVAEDVHREAADRFFESFELPAA